MLLINNQEVEKLFTMKACLEALEVGYHDLLKGDVVVSARVWISGRRASATMAITVGGPWKAPAEKSACSRSA